MELGLRDRRVEGGFCFQKFRRVAVLKDVERGFDLVLWVLISVAEAWTRFICCPRKRWRFPRWLLQMKKVQDAWVQAGKFFVDGKDLDQMDLFLFKAISTSTHPSRHVDMSSVLSLASVVSVRLPSRKGAKRPREILPFGGANFWGGKRLGMVFWLVWD